MRTLALRGDLITSMRITVDGSLTGASQFGHTRTVSLFELFNNSAKKDVYQLN